jgi:hypothetical protein
MIMTTLQTMYRGLSPHKIMPMPGTHMALHRTKYSLRSHFYGELRR